MSWNKSTNNQLKVFALVGFIFSMSYISLIFQDKIPFAHDTSQYLQLQYIYYNEIVQNRSIPLWFPFTAQGVTVNFFFLPQMTMLSPIIYLSGLISSKINFLYLFYISLWFEEMFFLLGIILLSSLYYKNSKTIFFVSISLLGTSIWYPQIYWNFHLFYFIPILLYCIHKWLQSARFYYLIFSILFFMLSVYGNFVYAFLFHSFVILSYLLFLLLFLKFHNLKFYFQNRLKFQNILIFLIIISMIALSLSLVIYQSDEIAFLGSQRNESGENSVETFLNYGGSIGSYKFMELLVRYGIPMNPDLSLYAGFLLVPFALIALLFERRKISFVVGGVTILLFLFSVGSFVSLFFYYVFPLGKIFRHIGLTASLFKLFIVLYAGFGFDYFVSSIETNKKKLVPFLLIYLILLTGLYIQITPGFYPLKYFWFISGEEQAVLKYLIYAVLGCITISVALILLTRINAGLLINVLLLFLVIDFFAYKYSMLNTRMLNTSMLSSIEKNLSGTQGNPGKDDSGENKKTIASLYNPFKYNFPEKREANTRLQLKDNERIRLFHSTPHIGALYNTTESFLYTDSVVSLYRTDFMLKPLKDFFDMGKKFPNKNNQVYEKFSGNNYPKLRVFSKLHIVENRSILGEIFSNENFTGDMIFAEKRDIKQDQLQRKYLQVENSDDFKNYDERLKAEIEIVNFSFNTLKLKIKVNGPKGEKGFLYYADTFHPNWNAYVNGQKTPVMKTNVGYKSIMVPFGTSEVIFKFGSFFYTASVVCTIIAVFLIFCSAIYLFFTDLGEKTKEELLEIP